MIDVFIVASLVVVLVAGSVRIAIEIYVRRRAAARRGAGHAAPSMPPEPPWAESAADPAEPFAETLAEPSGPTDLPPPVALFSVEMGSSHPRLCIAVGGRTIPVEIQPWQTAELARALLAAGAACAPGTHPPPEGTVFS